MNDSRKYEALPGEAAVPVATMRSSRLALAVAVALLGAQSVALAEKSPDDRDFNNRIYIGINGGLTTLEPRTSNTPFSVGDDSSAGGSLYLGYDISKRLSVEGFASQLGQAEIVRTLDNVVEGDIDYEGYGISAIGYLYNSRSASDYSNGFDDEGYYRREGLSIFGRVGATSLDTNSDAVDFEQLENFQLHLGAGLEYGWSNGIAARAEFISFDEDAKLLALGVLKRFGDAKPYPVAAPPVASPAVPAPPAYVPPAAPAPEPAPVVPAKPIELPVVHFDFDRSHLTGVAKAILDSFVADILLPTPELRIGIFGHTDAYGSESYNFPLSDNRAESVRKYLESKGIESSRLETKGFGEGSPVSENDSDENRAANRRVEFEILK